MSFLLELVSGNERSWSMRLVEQDLTPAEHLASDGEDEAMNWDTIKGNWKQAKGKVKEQWGKLTDDDLTRLEGNREQLVGKVQERYGIAKEEAERQVKDWETRYR